MADDAHQPSTALVAQQTRAMRTPVEDLVPVYDTSRFDHYGRIAAVMARSSLVPETLRQGDAVANCFQVVELADRWGYSPFAVAQCASVVYGKLMLEGKLVAAVLESKLGLQLNHYYTGEWGKDDYRIYVTDLPLDDELIKSLKPHIKIPGVRIVDGSVGEWKTFEQDKRTTKGNWLKQPDVQLQYRGDRTWARLFAPALTLGVITDDEMEEFATRQESRRQPLTSGFGEDAAALENARRSLVAPMAETPEPQPDNPQSVAQEPSDMRQTEAAGAANSEAQKPADAEPTPPDPKDEAPAPPRPKAGEVYLLAGDSFGDDAKRPTYKDGHPFSRVSEKSAGKLKEYPAHPEAAEARPTETASAPTAEAGPATPDSATAASDPSPEPQASGLESSPSAPAPSTETPTEAIFSDIDDPNPGEEELNPLLAAKIEIDGANSAKEIASIVARVSATDAYKGADEGSRNLVRQAAWFRYVILKDKGIEDGRVTGDSLMMALWLEFGAKSKAEIDSMWATFFQGEVYKALSEAWKGSFAKLVAKRKAALP